MKLVDEEDDATLGLGDVFKDRLQAFLEFAAKLRAGDERAHVERDDLAILEALGNVARDNPLREALDDGGLADAGFADENGVVLGPSAEHLNDATDFGVAADDGVHLAQSSDLDEVATVFFERLVLVVGVLGVHALSSTNLLERLEDVLLVDSDRFEEPLCLSFHLGQGQQ